MEWSTVIMSAIVSAVVSTGFGLGTAAYSTGLQMRAENRERARQAVRDAARERQRELLRHQDSDRPDGSRDKGIGYSAIDLSLARSVMEPAMRLGMVRRFLAATLTRQLFGRWAVERARLMKDSSDEAAFIEHLGASFNGRASSIDTGSWHAALCSPPKSSEVRTALLHLRLLEWL